MLEAGEDLRYVARRLVIFASEDVGNADPSALSLAVSAHQAVEKIGMPEARIPLAQAATYLACAPKSNAAYLALGAAIADLEGQGPLPVPMHLRNAPTGLMKELGYGEDYVYAHDAEDGFVAAENLPEGLAVAAALVTVGYSRGRAFWIALLSGFAEPLGGLVGALAVGVSAATLPVALGFAAGAMLFVISDEIIPETHRRGFETAATFALILGFVVMMGLDRVLG